MHAHPLGPQPAGAEIQVGNKGHTPPPFGHLP